MAAIYRTVSGSSNVHILHIVTWQPLRPMRLAAPRSMRRRGGALRDCRASRAERRARGRSTPARAVAGRGRRRANSRSARPARRSGSRTGRRGGATGGSARTPPAPGARPEAGPGSRVAGGAAWGTSPTARAGRPRGRGARARERFKNVHHGRPGLRPAPRGCFFSVPPIPEVSPVSPRPLPLGVALLCLLLGGAPRSATAQAAPYDSTVFAGLKWREIRIFRGGPPGAVGGFGTPPTGLRVGAPRRGGLQPTRAGD